ncbi:UDP-N-acetylglucosamine 2-epimerase [Lysobacter panacisoli]|uniref:UDP-N-acetylglucosamine 2-epimerase domain-containing protein n=1 Tax=Lysobacter panacisoli TaxID=1255263 RepID=A0ABP9LFN0_9GAMM|nr:UDP-N-acetylglucosamine 2-epimerase [Lysobacter panacisoli]
MTDPKLVAASAIALAVTLFAIFSMRPWARKIGLVDRPDARKRHRGSIPLIGGLCFFLGTLVGLSYLGYFDGFVTSLLAGSVLIVAAGALDDASDLSVTSRLLIEAGACGLVIFMSGFYVSDLGEIIGTRHIDLGLFGIPFTIVAVIGLINAFNMMDGIDGLAASMAMVCIVAIGMFNQAPWSAPGVLLMLQVLFAALVPYLFVNMGWPDGRKVFMGDAGSTLIGFLMAWALVYMSHPNVGRMSPPDVLWCVALPVMDTLAVMYRRIRSGGSPFRADRQHLHHLLCDTGMPPRIVLASMVGIAGLLLLLGFALRNVPQSLGLAAFVLVLALHVWWVPKALMRMRGRWPTREARPVPTPPPAPLTTNHGISFLAGLARFDDEDDDRYYDMPTRAGIALPSAASLIDAAPAADGEPATLVRALCVLPDSPDAVQMAPLAQRLVRDERFETTVCVSVDAEQDTPQVLHLFDLSADVHLAVPAASEDPVQVTSSALGGMKDVMTRVQPDLVVVPGDAPATLAATLAAHYHQVPVVCVDGGQSAGAPTSADDPGRRIARALASLHVAPDQSTGRQLVAEGVPANRVIVTGGAALDTLHSALQDLHPDSDLGRDFAERFAFLRDGQPLLLVMPRDEEDVHADSLMVAACEVAAQRPDLDVVCVATAVNGLPTPNLHRIDAPDYLAGVFLLGRAHLAYIAPHFYSEACAMDVPLLAMEPLHLPEGVRPTVHLLGGNADEIAVDVQRLLEAGRPNRAPFASAQTGASNQTGDASNRVADALAGLRSAAHASTTPSRDAGSPNQSGTRHAWEVT